MTAREQAHTVVRQWAELNRDVEGLAVEQGQDDEGAPRQEYILTLPGEHKLRTVVSLRVGEKSVALLAFVIRAPDENHEAVYRLLLRRNLTIPGLAYAVDTTGDIYLRGQVPLAGCTLDWLDQAMGAMLTASDGIFDEILALGFLSAMRTEWAWRLSRGESTRNLQAFAHLLQEPGQDDQSDSR